VRAKNAQGDGPYGDWLEVQTKPGAPLPPRDLKEDGVMPTAIKISFLPPVPPHGEIDEYKVRYK
jgi:hypothetical protein